MDVNTFDEAIKQEGSKLNINDSDLEDISYEGDFYSSEEEEDEIENGIVEIPESMLSYLEIFRKRASVLEQLILEDLEDDDVHSIPTSYSDNRLNKDAADSDEEVKFKDLEVISESINEDGTTHPNELEVDWIIENEVECDEHVRSERQLHLEMKALESQLKSEDERRRVDLQLMREKHQDEERQREEWKKCRQRDFEGELRRIDRANKPPSQGMDPKETEIEETHQKELLQQEELIHRLQRQVEEEKRALEERLTKEKKRIEERRNSAAIRIQAHFRGLLARRWSRAQLNCRKEEKRKFEEKQKRRREMEERCEREREEERRRREMEDRELERRRAIYVRAKQEEHLRLEREGNREEDIRKREEEGRKKKEEEENRKQEEEIRKREEEGRKKKEEEENRKQGEEIRKREEGVRKKKEEEENRKQGEEIRKREEGMKKKEEEESRKQEEGNSRKRDEEEKREDEEKKTEERTIEEVNKKWEGEKRKKEEEEIKRERERRKTEAEDKKIDINERRQKEQGGKRQEEEEKSIQPNLFNSQTIRLSDNKNLKNIGPTQTKSFKNNKELGSRLQMESPVLNFITERVDKYPGGPSELQSNATTTDSQPVTPDPVPVTFNRGSMTLSEHTEQKRLAWMKDCIPWSKLSLENKRKKNTKQRRRARRASEGGCLPPLSPDVLLQCGGWGSLQEVTTVCLEDLPGCSLSTLAQCPSLQSLTLRRCGLRALDGLNQCGELLYIDVQENDIMVVDCENLVNLRVLRLGRNRLTSIHGLEGAVNLTVLELSYNSITRIGGLESLKRLQRLSIDHNQLISTKELREVYTLLHLDCSHNHLSSVEGLDNCALLNTLNLSGNNLTEPPLLKNQVLLRELHLEDNNISSLGGLQSCWLPLMQLLLGAQNSIVQLSALSDCVSLVKLDLSHNCLSEVENVCESLERCPSLQEVDLTGNPLQQESNWRSSLLKAVPGLRDMDGHLSGSFRLPPTGVVLSYTMPEGSFLAFCQAQLQQLHTLQDRHSRELGGALSFLDAVKISSRHHDETLQLVEEQRYAHEYGDTTATQTPSDIIDTQTTKIMDKSIDKYIDECIFERPETKCSKNRESDKVSFRNPTMDVNQKSISEKQPQLPADSPNCSSRVRSSMTKLNLSAVDAKTNYVNFKEEKPFSEPSKTPTPNPWNLELKSMAAIVIQRHWRQHRRCRSIPVHPEGVRGKRRGGGGGRRKLDTRTLQNGNLDPSYAATVIQASWRGFALRKRLVSALAAARVDEGDDCFEEVDVNEFVFDETRLERDWMSFLSEVSSPLSLPLPPQPKHHVHFPESYQPGLPPALQWKPKQAWVGMERTLESSERRASPGSTSRNISPASASGLSGLSARSEKILEEWGFTDSHTALLMLKRARKMKSKMQRQQKLRDPAVRLALFRNHSQQHVPIEAPKKPSPIRKDYFKALDEELAQREARQEGGEEEQMRVMQARTSQWLHIQAVHSDGQSERDHFLPQIDADVLNGGRVQLVAGAGYREGTDRAPGFRANSGSVSLHSKDQRRAQIGSFGPPKNKVPSPKRATSVPSKKERISFRDNPVQMSGGWGGGKKRDKVQK